MLDDEKLAWRWERKRKEIRSVNLDGEEIYFAPAGDETNLEYSDCLSFITNLIDLPFDEFDELFTETNKIHMIRFNRERERERERELENELLQLFWLYEKFHL